MTRAIVTATGSYLPEGVITNESLMQFSAEARRLILEKTGVRERRHGDDGQCTSDLAICAARNCLKHAGLDVGDVEGIILSTSSPDRMQPATATRVQAELGAVRAFALDINSVCSGSTFGIALCDALIRSGMYRCLLFIAAEMYSRILNSRDFTTYPYFGDGAGAVLFTASEGRAGVVHSCMATDGSRADVICVPGGGTMMPFDKLSSPRLAYFRMRGEEVLAFSLEKGPEVIRRLLAETDTDVDDVACIISHQANINIIRGIAQKLSIPEKRFYVNLDRYGNTASASVLIALDEAIREGRIGSGDLVITVSFGGGLSWGANLIRF